MRANSSLQDGEGSRCKLVLFELSNLVLAVFVSQRATNKRLVVRVCGRFGMARGLNVRELITRLAQKLPRTCQRYSKAPQLPDLRTELLRLTY